MPAMHYHMPLSCKNRLKALFDDGSYENTTKRWDKSRSAFRDKRKYLDRIKEARSKTGLQALYLSQWQSAWIRNYHAVFSFEFMGGSMGSAVGNYNPVSRVSD